MLLVRFSKTKKNKKNQSKIAFTTNKFVQFKKECYNMLYDMSDDMSDVISYDMSDDISDVISYDMSDDISDVISYDMSDDMSDDISDDDKITACLNDET